MKRNFIWLIAGMSLTALLSFATTYEVKDTTAEVKKIQNVVVFTDCVPVKEYEVIGTASFTFFSLKSEGKHSTVLRRLVEKAKEKYPEAEGFIYNVEDQNAEVIKFKK